MIPRSLHRIALGEPPPWAERWWAKFADLHPGWELQTWKATSGDFPLTSPYWDKCTQRAQQADLMRYEVLLREGGVYVDWDVEPYRPLDPFLGLQGFVACEAKDRTGNAIMGFEPGHPAVRAILDITLAEIVKPHPDIMTAGPLAVTKVCIGRKDVLILPAGSFYEMPWSARESARDGQLVKPWVYAVHRCAASWMPQAAAIPAKAGASPSRVERIGAVIPTRYHPAQLGPLQDVLARDGVYTLTLESEDYGHELHQMWNDGVRRLVEAGCSVVAILNDDIIMASGTLAFMTKALRSNPKAAVVCPDTDPAKRHWPVRQRPEVPPKVRLALSTGKMIQQAGFAFLYDPLDPDVPIFNEAFHLWHGDIEFFDAIRSRGRAVATAMGLIIVHEGSHSTKKVLNTTARDVWGEASRQAAAGVLAAGPLFEDITRARLHKHEGEA